MVRSRRRLAETYPQIPQIAINLCNLWMALLA
jgi:hypothetical protein